VKYKVPSQICYDRCLIQIEPFKNSFKKKNLLKFDSNSRRRLNGAMEKTNKANGAEEQPKDDANSEANTWSYQMEASSEHGNTTPSNETPTTTDTISTIDQPSLADRGTITNVEQRVASNESILNESRIKDLEDQCARLQKTVKSLEERLDSCDSRYMRQNICIIGVTEGAENGNVVELVVKVIETLLGEESFGNKALYKKKCS